MTPERSSVILASIDLGSHTARLLIARWEAGRLRSLLRKRAYIRLAQDFESSESGTVKQAGSDRGRAEVIPAGSLVVKEILNFFHSSEMMVSLTELLEKALLDILGVPLEI